MNRLVLIGGSTAVGKSTLIKELEKKLNNPLCYRRVQGFYDLAKLNNIDEKDVFSSISPFDVDDYFVTKCVENELVVSDVHFAVQMDRGSVDFPNIHAPYVGTISKELIDKLTYNGVEIIPILLENNPEICFNREVERYNCKQKGMRNISIEDTQNEILSERREFLIVSNSCEKSLFINVSNKTPEELALEVFDFIKGKCNKKLIKK